MAQAMRAILLASAMAATLVGRRANSAVSQGRCFVPWILSLDCNGPVRESLRSPLRGGLLFLARQSPSRNQWLAKRTRGSLGRSPVWWCAGGLIDRRWLVLPNSAFRNRPEKTSEEDGGS